MNFIKWIGILSFVLFVSCGGDKGTDDPPTDKEGGDQQTEEERVLEEHIDTVEPATPEDETQKKLTCNIQNYKNYIFDVQKMERLVEETGTGCYLLGVDFSDQNLTDAVFMKSNLKGAIFKAANLKGAQFIEADLTNAVLEDTNYMEAYFTDAILTGATYNEYSRITAWGKLFSGKGIRDPQGKGMIYTGPNN